jgi:hypothetical protein
MNNQEAKFILGAYRPDGQDATDPKFAEALAQAGRDPELRAWLEQQRKFDATLTHKLREIAPPPGLREAILAGTRVSAAPGGRRRGWPHPAWFAAAAAVIAVAAIVSTRKKPEAPRPAVAEFAALAARDLTDAHTQHTGHPGPLAAVQAQFAQATLPLPGHFSLDLEDLRRKGCRIVRLGGREVFELCLQRDGKWYHLYAARRDEFAPGKDDPWALLGASSQLTSTAWSDANNVYALVANTGPESIRRLI